MQHIPVGHRPLSQGWWLAQASKGPQKQPLRSVRTQQLHVPPELWQSIATLHGLLMSQPQSSLLHGGGGGLPPWANAGTCKLERMGALHTTAAPTPALFNIVRRDTSLTGASVSSIDPSLHRVCADNEPLEDIAASTKRRNSASNPALERRRFSTLGDC